jgi:hypothetical protein
MQTDVGLDMDYPCLDCESAADAHDVHPFFDRPSWQDGYARGYVDGRSDGEHLREQALRAQVAQHLRTLECDLRLRLRHDLDTPLEVLQTIARLVEAPTARR